MTNKFDPILGRYRQSDVSSISSGATDPETATSGQWFINTTSDTLKFYYNGVWTIIQQLPPDAPTIFSINSDETSPGSAVDATLTVVVNGVQNGDLVKLYVDGVEDTSGTATTTSITLTTSALTVGEYPIDATTTRNSVESNTSEAWYFEVLTPTAPTIYSVAGDTSGTFTSDDPTPDVVVNDVVSGDLVTVYADAVEVGSGTASTTSITITTSALAEAENSLTAVITRNGLDSAESTAFLYTYEAPAFSATGGTEYTVSGVKYHKYLLADTATDFTVSGSGDVSVLLIAGGGAGCAGGGGAGGVLYDNAYSLTAGAIEVTVGDGGNWVSGSANGGSGGNSVFGSLTAVGGGGGAWNNGPDGVGSSGGSGGGGNFTGAGTSTPGTGTAGQGYDGGDNAGQNGNGYPAGGGGGAGALGGDATSGQAGGGGVGIDTYSDVLEAVGEGILSTTYWIGGGGGGGCYNGGSAGNGGLGGGGNGAVGGTAGSAGTDNTGGGGGGCNGTGGSGGSGMVIIYYAV